MRWKYIALDEPPWHVDSVSGQSAGISGEYVNGMFESVCACWQTKLSVSARCMNVTTKLPFAPRYEKTPT